jgi:hypothetical protein
MKSCGMSFDVSLKDINIGMPRNLADMDALGQQSLYLIKVNHESYVLFMHCCVTSLQ